MPIIACPHCGTRLNAPDSTIGREVVCGRCKRAFVAAVEAAAPPAPPVAGAGVGAPAPPAPPAGPAAAAPFAPPPPVRPPPAAMPGAYPPPPLPPPGFPPGFPVPQTSGYAVASLILGIASIVTCWCAVPPLICGILALVFHSHAMRDICAGLTSPDSAGMARGGRICGIIGLVLTIVAWSCVLVTAIVSG